MHCGWCLSSRQRATYRMMLVRRFDWQANLPLLQRELLHCAHLARQSPHQYLMHHEHSVLDVVAAAAPAAAPQQLPGGHRRGSPREDGAAVIAGVVATPETTSPAAAHGSAAKRKPSPDDRYETCEMNCGGDLLTPSLLIVTNKLLLCDRVIWV